MAALVAAPAAAAQGGVTAPDLSDPCPAVYPGDSASRERLARWMARSAADRGLPRELPVMAAIAESGLRNLRGEDYHGFFGMHESLNAGVYRGFPSRPELQLRWFLDSAAAVRQRRIAEGMPDPAADEGDFGLWIADVERPAPQNRSGYQPHLGEARRLIGSRCPAPASARLTAPPPLAVRLARRQRPAMGTVESVCAARRRAAASVRCSASPSAASCGRAARAPRRPRTVPGSSSRSRFRGPPAGCSHAGAARAPSCKRSG